MGEFRIGRSRAQHSYPEAKFGAAGAGPFARNSAVSAPPETTVPVAPGIQIPWGTIESGAAPGVHVPITPKTTGILRVTAAITMKNTGLTPANITVNLQLDDANLAVPVDEEVTILAPNPDQTYVTIPVVVSGLSVTKALHNISILLTANGAATIFLVSATIDVQEVVTATG